MNLKELKKWLWGRRPGEETTEEASPADQDEETPRSADVSKPGRHGNVKIPRSSQVSRKPDRIQPGTCSPRDVAKPRPVSRQGIPIINPNEDVARLFLGSKAPRGQAVDGPSPEERRGVSLPERPSTSPPPSGRAGKTAWRRNRLGIRQLNGSVDFQDIFEPAAPNDASPPEQPAAAPAGGRQEEIRRRLMVDVDRDRHGIPRLDNRTDVSRFFEATVEDSEENASAQELGEAFRASIDHDARRLMKKKSDGFFAPRRLALKEKLRRYPAPQAQVDLHGDTALIARQRADAFLRRASADGSLTLRIIVGKGLHSEGGAVLPDVIEDLLMAMKREGLVLSYRWEKAVKRKSGAVIVYLHLPYAS